MKPKTSPIWNYFIEIGDLKARCKLCDKIYSRKGRTTTALKSHLKALHAEEFADFKKLDEAVKLSTETKKEKTPPLNVIESEASESQETSSHSETSEPVPSTLHQQRLSGQALERPNSLHSNPYIHTAGQHLVTKILPTEIMAAKRQTEENFDCINSLSSQRKDFDEYDHFAFMLAAKIRRISDEYEREILMNTIQNEVFQTIMKNNRNSTTSRDFLVKQESNQILFDSPGNEL